MPVIDMEILTAIEYLQALIVVVLFFGILAMGFKVWRWNYA
ncbi:MAG: hypothetical protein A4E50_01888 [Methanosaeta sp. PtaB.Bin087]|jgi:hypothetical protein|nr:MAG: hypothetical protein A4E50_01888 [Methanosaeta sp. PtaB.Bin087]OPY52370.1 MAG: hypothetical protein A4E51_01354 [Methanosaeta sp. PtaU1.Bin055]HOI70467.1 hypothetical protein [Methanothrix sp.]